LQTYQYLCHKRKAVFAAHSLAFFDALQQLLRLADVLEKQRAIGQTPAQVERMPEPARMGQGGVADLYGLLGIAEHPGRKCHPG